MSAMQALWGNYTAAMDDLGGFNASVPVYVASGLLTYLSAEGAHFLLCVFWLPCALR